MESNVLVSIVMPLSLAIIMFGMGLSLRIDDFKRIFVLPKAVAIGIFGQIILLPVFGYLFAHLFDLAPEDAVGIMVLVACAGGAVSNLIVYLAKADLALSVTLTAISCCITVITIPFVINFALFEFMAVSEQAPLPIGSTNVRLFILTLLPVLVGMLMGHYFSDYAQRIERHVAKVASTFFIVIILAMLVKEAENLLRPFIALGPVILSLNLSTMVIGFMLARGFKLNHSQSVTISIEVGLQNSITGIYIAASLLNNSAIAVIPALYGLIMLFTSGLLIGWLRRGALRNSEMTITQKTIN